MPTQAALSMIGQVLGHYRILEKLGAGGMGIVYRAHDEQLDRDVALKILAPRAVTDESSRRRFRKEALGLAKLNHPNIGMIHEFGTENGIDFLVMELVAGENTSQPPMRFNHLFTIVPSGMKTTCREAVLHAHLSKISMPPESSNWRVPTMGSARTAWHDAATSIAGSSAWQ